MWPKTRAQSRVAVVGELAEIRNLAGVPQQPHLRGRCASARISGSRASAASVSRSVASLPRTRPGPGGGAVRLSSSASTAEIEFAVAPAKLRPARSNPCASTAATTSSASGGQCGGGAERAVTHAAPGAAGDLRHFGGVQRARPVAVEFPDAGEGDMVDVHVQAHADRVGRDQEIDLLLLVKRHLGVAGARRQPAHHHGAAAAPAADQFGDGVDLGGAERDHGASAAAGATV